MMMRPKTKLTGLSPPRAYTAANGVDDEWEMRPGGMLVQKRVDSDQNAAPPPNIRVRVKYGSVYHEIGISGQATFGELKKKLSGPTGLYHEDQKVLFKDKERDSKAYLDTSGVKDKSKLVLVEDPISQEKRLVEMRRNAKMEKAAKSISDISLGVDRLAAQVSALESIISKGGKVGEKEVLNLIELLMNELIKLDAIVAVGDVKLQRKIQVRRVQKYVEALDLIRIKTSAPASNGFRDNPMPSQPRHANAKNTPLKQASSPHPRPPRHSIGHSPLRTMQQAQPPRNSTSGTVVTTQWETFDSTPALNQILSPPLIPLSSTATTGPSHPNNNKFSWDLL